MNDALSYIDDFFKGNPGPMEKQVFEKRLKEDPAFAEEVAFYVATINVLKDESKTERREKFRQMDTKVVPMKSRMTWIYSAAASVLVLMVATWLFVGNRSTPVEMADRYINEKFDRLPGVTMGTRDSFQMGLRLHNDEKKLNEALQVFLDLEKRESTVNSEVKKNIGIIHLKLGQYDKALDYFKQVADIEGLEFNYGLFYQAITLLKRNQPGDSDLAKKLLEQVDEYNLAGKDEAKKILDRF